MTNMTRAGSGLSGSAISARTAIVTDANRAHLFISIVSGFTMPPCASRSAASGTNDGWHDSSRAGRRHGLRELRARSGHLECEPCPQAESCLVEWLSSAPPCRLMTVKVGTATARQPSPNSPHYRVISDIPSTRMSPESVAACSHGTHPKHGAAYDRFTRDSVVVRKQSSTRTR